MRGCRLLYFVKSKSGTKCKNFVFLCQYVHSFTFPEMAGRGGPSHPPKSATDNIEHIYIYIYNG